MDGIVRCHVNIVRIGLDDEAVCLGDVRKVIGFTRSDFIGFPEEGSRFHGLVGPYPGIQITAALLEEICCMHDELHTAAALDEDDMVIVRNSQELL